MPEWSGYHVKTDGRAYFRPYVPKELKPHFGPCPMVNLRMKASRNAERLALMHYIAHEARLEAKRKELTAAALKPRPVPLEKWSAERRQRFATEIAQGFNRTQHAALQGLAPRTELLTLHDLLAEVAGDVLSASGTDGLTTLAALFLTAADIPYRHGEPAFRSLVFELATALDTEFVTPSHQRLHERKAVAPPPLPDQAAPVAAPLTLGKVIDEYIATKERARSGYTRKIVLCLRLFKEMAGAATPVSELRQLHITNFLRDICRLPVDWASRFDKGTSVAAMLDEEPDEVMSPTTYRDNYRAPLKAFLRDSQRDYGDAGFPARTVDGIEYAGNRKSGEEAQRDLTMPELKRLFEGPEFAAVADDATALAAYWMPIIGLYTGARPREICQLNPQCDWGVESGIHFLLFDPHTPAGARVVKSIKSTEERRVPMHSELVRLGLPTYLQRLKDAGADRIFPDAPVNKGNAYGRAGEAFTAFLQAVGIYDDTAPPGRKVLGMYCFRKTFITHAGNQGIPTFGMTGHRPEHMTAIQWRHYRTSAASLSDITKDLEQVVFPIRIPLRS